MGMELMYGGQGKVTNNISLTSVTATRVNGECYEREHQ